jgi:hypothetical protein
MLTARWEFNCDFLGFEFRWEPDRVGKPHAPRQELYNLFQSLHELQHPPSMTGSLKIFGGGIFPVPNTTDIYEVDMPP